MLSCDPTTPSFPSQYILLKKTLEHHFPNLLEFVSVLVPWGEGVVRGSQTPEGLEELSKPPPPTPCLCQEEERATRVTGEFEVFVEGKLVHSKKVTGPGGSKGQR